MFNIWFPEPATIAKNVPQYTGVNMLVISYLCQFSCLRCRKLYSGRVHETFMRWSPWVRVPSSTHCSQKLCVSAYLEFYCLHLCLHNTLAGHLSKTNSINNYKEVELLCCGRDITNNNPANITSSGYQQQYSPKPHIPRAWVMWWSDKKCMLR